MRHAHFRSKPHPLKVIYMIIYTKICSLAPHAILYIYTFPFLLLSVLLVLYILIPLLFFIHTLSFSHDQSLTIHVPPLSPSLISPSIPPSPHRSLYLFYSSFKSIITFSLYISENSYNSMCRRKYYPPNVR